MTIFEEIRSTIHTNQATSLFDVQYTEQCREAWQEYATQNDYVIRFESTTIHLHPVSVWDLSLCACALCGQPLKDATSVQAGVGPWCRKKYKYEDAIELSADIIAKCEHLVEFGADFVQAIQDNDSRQAANILCRWIALWVNKARCHDKTVRAIQTLQVMGYDLLAQRTTKRLCKKWSIEPDGDYYAISYPFNPTWSDTLRGFRGSYFNKDKRCWMVPKNHRKALWAALGKAHKNTFIKGPQGIFIP